MIKHILYSETFKTAFIFDRCLPFTKVSFQLELINPRKTVKNQAGE